MNKEFDTTKLQQFSLTQAMSTIGYQLMRNPQGRHAFVNFNQMRWGKGVIAVSTAIRMYNESSFLDYMLSPDSYEKNQFDAAKIVKIVKLQYSSKKKGFVNTATNYVKFIDPSYENLFLMSEEDSNNVI